MTEFFISCPAVLKIFGALAVILIISHFYKKLILAVIAGILVLGFWEGHSFSSIIKISYEKTFSLNCVMLLGAIFLIIWLSKQMDLTGVMKELVYAIRVRVSPRVALGVMPAVIGLLPMPGGAIFSAPMVDNCDTENVLSPDLKTQINYWFRHIWEYWWPLYPGVLLAVDLAGIEIWQFVLVQLPLCFCSIGIGYFYFLRKVPKSFSENNKFSGKRPSILPLLAPIIIVVVTYIVLLSGSEGLRKVYPGFIKFHKYIPLMIGIFAAIFSLQIFRPLGLSQWKNLLISKKTFSLVGIVLAVQIFGAFITSPLPNGELFVEQIREDMFAWKIPVIAVTMLIPFVCGMTMGICVAFVGASFPIVINLLGGDASLSSLISTSVLAYGFGYAGVLLSPIHICLIVTNEHFKTHLIPSLLTLLRPVVSLLLCVVAIYSMITVFW